MKTRASILGVLCCAAMLFINQARAQSPPTNGMVADHSFNGNPNDDSGNGNNLSNHGATLCADRFGRTNQAYSFNGADQYLGSTVSPLSQLDNWTMMAWIRPGSLPQSVAYAVCVGFDNGSVGDGYAFGISENATAPGTGFGSGNQLWGVFPGVGFIPDEYDFTSTNVWSQITMVDTNGSIMLYVNGAPTTVVSVPGGGPTVPSSIEVGSGSSSARFFNGAVDEVRIYDRALSESDVEQIYAFESTNGVIGIPPSITFQPLSQSVIQGTNVTFTSSATGTGPFNFQWSFDGTALDGATNTALTLNDVQGTNVGSYALTVNTPYGTAVSSNAFLTIELPPTIAAQPRNQVGVVGGDVTFSVAVGPPPITSGTLQLWLKADAGLVTNDSGQISTWHDQSGETNDASQANSHLWPTVVHPNGLGGQAAVRFNGVQDGVNGQYLGGTGVNVPDAMTAFSVYNFFADTSTEVAWLVGQTGTDGAIRCLDILSQELTFGTWNLDYKVPGQFPINTYRICTDRVNTNHSSVEIFDATASGETKYSFAMSGEQHPAQDYFVGGVDPTMPAAGSGYNFAGDLAELIIYSGYLIDSDRSAVVNYLQQKYFQTNGATADSFNFQWQFDGTNIAGATNATLTLTNVSSSEKGSYTVIVTGAAGSTTSSNAVLTTVDPPTLTFSPTNQTVVAGTTAVFSGVAAGTPPLSYQWHFDGTNIAGATNTSVSITNAVIANAGTYTLVATSPYGSASSLPATLTVDESTIQIVGTSVGGGGSIVVPIDLIAVGTEGGVGFTVNFDPAVLTYSGVVLGSGAAGAGLVINSNQADFGRLGVGVALFNGTFSVGTQEVFDVTFQVAAVTNPTSTELTFGNQPAGEQVSDPLANPLPAIFVPGTVSISPTLLAGDVSPRPNGNEAVNITDWIQEGRFVAGLDTVSNGGEFQRADCAPRSTQGDGQLTVADWVQVGRYAVGLDPATAAGGPTSPGPQIRTSRLPGKDDVSPSLTLLPLSQGGETNSVVVQMIATGNVNSLGFSVAFNPAMIRFVNASLGSGALGAALVQNTLQAASGNLGFLVGLLAPATFATGTQQLVTLRFSPVTYSNTAALVFSDTPIARQLVDTNTDILAANYVNATVAVGGLVWPVLSINQNGSNVALSWPTAAAVFSLQSATSLDGTWGDVTITPATIDSNLVVTIPNSAGTVYYRLKY